MFTSVSLIVVFPLVLFKVIKFSELVQFIFNLPLFVDGAFKIPDENVGTCVWQLKFNTNV